MYVCVCVCVCVYVCVCVCVCMCMCVCVTGGHQKCFDLQTNATASLGDVDCRLQKGCPVRWQP